MLALNSEKEDESKGENEERDHLPKQTEPLRVSHAKVEYSAVMTVNIYTAFTRCYSGTSHVYTHVIVTAMKGYYCYSHLQMSN